MMLEASTAKSTEELTEKFQNDRDVMAKIIAQLRQKFKTSNVHKGGSGSAASTAAASSLGSVGGMPAGTGIRPPAQKRQQREDCPPRALEIKEWSACANTKHTDLRRWRSKTEVRNSKDLLEVDGQNQFDWAACEEEQRNFDKKATINLWFTRVVPKDERFRKMHTAKKALESKVFGKSKSGDIRVGIDSSPRRRMLPRSQARFMALTEQQELHKILPTVSGWGTWAFVLLEGYDSVGEAVLWVPGTQLKVTPWLEMGGLPTRTVEESGSDFFTHSDSNLC